MGMCAEILAIGPFNKSIVKSLEYPNEFYKNTVDGTIVIEHLFGIAEGTSLSKEFAKLFGVPDVWDFNQHKLNTKKIDLSKLQEFAKTYEYDQDFENLVVFIKAGFEFYFIPNG